MTRASSIDSPRSAPKTVALLLLIWMLAPAGALLGVAGAFLSVSTLFNAILVAAISGPALWLALRLARQTRTRRGRWGIVLSLALPAVLHALMLVVALCSGGLDLYDRTRVSWACRTHESLIPPGMLIERPTIRFETPSCGLLGFCGRRRDPGWSATLLQGGVAAIEQEQRGRPGKPGGNAPLVWKRYELVQSPDPRCFVDIGADYSTRGGKDFTSKSLGIPEDQCLVISDIVQSRADWILRTHATLANASDVQEIKSVLVRAADQSEVAWVYAFQTHPATNAKGMGAEQHSCPNKESHAALLRLMAPRLSDNDLIMLGFRAGFGHSKY